MNDDRMFHVVVVGMIAILLVGVIAAAIANGSGPASWQCISISRQPPEQSWKDGAWCVSIKGHEVGQYATYEEARDAGMKALREKYDAIYQLQQSKQRTFDK